MEVKKLRVGEVVCYSFCDNESIVGSLLCNYNRYAKYKFHSVMYVNGKAYNNYKSKTVKGALRKAKAFYWRAKNV